MLKEASEALAAHDSRPILTVYPSSTFKSPAVTLEFRKGLPAIEAEADKYGRRVNPYLV